EGSVLYLTAIFGGAFVGWYYGPLGLFRDELFALYLPRLDLYRNELFVVDALGIVGLIAALTKERVGLRAAALPLVWAACFAGLLICRFAPATGASQSYFLALVMGSVAGFGLLTFLLRQYAAASA